MGFPEDVEAVNVENLRFGDAVGLLVGVRVEGVAALCLGDAVEQLENAESEEGAVGLPEDAEIGEGAVDPLGDAEVGEGAVWLLEDVEFEGVAALQSEASHVETLVVVEATQVFELAFGSFDCPPDLDKAFSQEEPYSFPGQEKKPLLEMELEIDGAADCQKARDYDRAAASGVLEIDAEALLLRAVFDGSQEVG